MDNKVIMKKYLVVRVSEYSSTMIKGAFDDESKADTYAELSNEMEELEGVTYYVAVIKKNKGASNSPSKNKIMAVAKKIELTANQLWVLKYILHEVASSEEGANGIHLTPKERVSLRQIRSKL